ncbi:HPr-like protein Crh [Paraliobacillus sp. PM-2]|uniref:HPr family phosphocarrier protein n=1 Tax=Paraliobacillus sp. PM-2 TaxID=1462524 RepID=UPI00061CD79D|nr:HPr family phosphocarrier protein [Paraliobacillus sp. PM-2]CQR46486.1 HPr-like protein Crh [Paraliobacillus sp. PM-2]
MVEKEVLVGVTPGLEAEPATLFVQKANAFASEIFIEKGNRRVNAKSIMGLLGLSIKKHSTIHLIANGNDDQQAIETLSTFLEAEKVITD